MIDRSVSNRYILYTVHALALLCRGAVTIVFI
jgi:hypothetical protein